MVQPVVICHQAISLGSYGGLKSEVVEAFSRKVAFFAFFVECGRPEVREISHCLPDKKQNFRSDSRSRFCADRAQNLQGQLQTIYSEFPKFHLNPFTSGGVIDARANIVETCHKVFPILGEATAPRRVKI